MKNIALIGFMGSGKSTIAKLLAEKLNYRLIEADNDIIRLSEYSSINEIFENRGEEHFRELEKIAISDAVKATGQVISCGGGVVTSAETMEILKKNATVVFLHADFKTIIERLNNTVTRPLFRDTEKAILLYANRLPKYKKYADMEIITDHSSPTDITAAIIQRLSHSGKPSGK